MFAQTSLPQPVSVPSSTQQQQPHSRKEQQETPSLFLRQKEPLRSSLGPIISFPFLGTCLLATFNEGAEGSGNRSNALRKKLPQPLQESSHVAQNLQSQPRCHKTCMPGCLECPCVHGRFMFHRSSQKQVLGDLIQAFDSPTMHSDVCASLAFTQSGQ